MRIYSNKERSAAIRAELKKLGYNSKQISVRSGDCGYSDYTNIRIKDMAIRINDVKKVCKAFESVDYDEYTGEILAGGNCYISVDYDYDALEEARKNELPKVEELIKGIDKGEQKRIERKDFDYVLYSDDKGFYMACYKKGEHFGMLGFKAWNLESFKYSLAGAFATDFEDFRK